ncbi:hypothetical protein DY000_02026732 [Brassica cretica]|uniref:Uncharacterized protein n=1 Tax=Brassica cretica TaxID=69181 RepID=A0ABQ7EKE5_BRACR|nr:hypothetical protein DY000_02026732 [Brassica cretica]
MAATSVEYRGLIVLPKRQKLLYPKVGNKLSDDSLLLSQIPLKRSLKMTMIGTTEDDIIVDQVTSQDIVDDFELDLDDLSSLDHSRADRSHSQKITSKGAGRHT